MKFNTVFTTAQMALVAADRGMLPCLKKLTLEVAGEQTIPLGCRGRHPDLSHLASLSISPHIALCVNFLRYLSSLRSDGVAMCPRLVGALEARPHPLQNGGAMPCLHLTLHGVASHSARLENECVAVL